MKKQSYDRRIRRNPNGSVTITPVQTEGEARIINAKAKQAKCCVHWHEFMTHATVTGTQTQVDAFVKSFFSV